jgi:hypothetical protein
VLRALVRDLRRFIRELQLLSLRPWQGRQLGGPQPPSGDIWLHEIKLDGFGTGLRYRRHDAGVIVVAFDLIELNGEDVRRETPKKIAGVEFRPAASE